MPDPTAAEISDAIRVVRAHALDEMPFCRASLREARGDEIADHPAVIEAIQQHYHALLTRQKAAVERLQAKP